MSPAFAALPAPLLALTLLFSPAAKQDPNWDQLNASGRQSYTDGRFDEAEQLFRQALELAEGFGPDDTRIAVSATNLALLHRSRGRLSDAEALHVRALEIDRRVYGPEHTETAIDMANLAVVCTIMGDYRRAETLLRQALEIHERAGAEGEMAKDLNALAAANEPQAKYSETEA